MARTRAARPNAYIVSAMTAAAAASPQTAPTVLESVPDVLPCVGLEVALSRMRAFCCSAEELNGRALH